MLCVHCGNPAVGLDDDRCYSCLSCADNYGQEIIPFFDDAPTIHILYPDNRYVSEVTIVGWAKDSLVNAVIEHKHYETDADLDADVLAVQSSDEYVNMTLLSAMEILEDDDVTFSIESRNAAI